MSLGLTAIVSGVKQEAPDDDDAVAELVGVAVDELDADGDMVAVAVADGVPEGLPLRVGDAEPQELLGVGLGVDVGLAELDGLGVLPLIV